MARLGESVFACFLAFICDFFSAASFRTHRRIGCLMSSKVLPAVYIWSLGYADVLVYKVTNCGLTLQNVRCKYLKLFWARSSSSALHRLQHVCMIQQPFEILGSERKDYHRAYNVAFVFNILSCSQRYFHSFKICGCKPWVVIFLV